MLHTLASRRRERARGSHLSAGRRRPIQPESRAGARAPEPDRSTGAESERFREALSRWASTVTLVAVRDADTDLVHATTVTSFAPVAADPPQVFVALGPGAQVLPFLEVGGAVGVSLLDESQAKWATIFADAFPVEPAPWKGPGAPLLAGAVVALACTVRQVHGMEGGASLVACRVEEVTLGEGDRPLLYWRRGYGRIGEG